MPLIQDIQITKINKPLTKHFMTSRDASRRSAVESINLGILLEDGSLETSEVVTPPYICGETSEKSLKALEEVKLELIGADVMRHRIITDILNRFRETVPAAMAGVEIAVWKCISRITRTPLWMLWGGVKQEVITDFTISPNAEFESDLDEVVKAGFSTIKVKMGVLGKRKELSALRQLYDKYPNVILRVDCNQAFHPEEALEVIKEIRCIGFNLELMEQPTPAHDLQALRRVKEMSPVPIIADESVCTFSDALRIYEERAAHGYNIKLMKSGISQAMSMVALAQSTGMRLMLGCMMEGRANTEVSLAFACGTGAFDYIDLDSFMFLQDDGSDASFKSEGERLMMG